MECAAASLKEGLIVLIVQANGIAQPFARCRFASLVLWSSARLRSQKAKGGLGPVGAQRATPAVSQPRGLASNIPR